MSRYIRPRPARPRRKSAPVAAIPWQHGSEPVPQGRLLRLAIAASVLIFVSGVARAADFGGDAVQAPSAQVSPHD